MQVHGLTFSTKIWKKSVVNTCAFGIRFTVSRGDKEWSYLKNKKQKKHSEKNYILTVKM